jgi:CBS domain-containing protein
MGGAGERSLFVRRVRDLMGGPAATCTPATSVADVAGLMHRDTAVVVMDPDGAPLGIVTDADLRARVGGGGGGGGGGVGG